MSDIPLPPDVGEDVGLPEVSLPTCADQDGAALFASPTGRSSSVKNPKGKAKPKAVLKGKTAKQNAKAKSKEKKSKGEAPKAKGKAKAKSKAESKAKQVRLEHSEDFQSKAVHWTGTPVVPFDDLVAKVAGAFPPPALASTMAQRDHLWEIFSPPRVGPVIRRMGGRSTRSVDVKTFWNLRDAKIQHQLLSDVITLRPYCSWAQCYDYSGYAYNWPNTARTKFY